MNNRCPSRRCRRQGIPSPGFTLCDDCRAYQRAVSKKSRLKNIQTRRETDRVSMQIGRQRSRLEIMERLGGKCTCCGEDRYEFLTVDHVHKNGASHRRELGIKENANASFYRKAIKAEDLTGLQILCANCHNAKDLFGGCPHKTGVSIKEKIVAEVREYDLAQAAKAMNREGKKSLVVKCSCGCGEPLSGYDERSRKKKFIHGHNRRKPTP